MLHVQIAPDDVIKTNTGEISEGSGSKTHASVRNEYINNRDISERIIVEFFFVYN